MCAEALLEWATKIHVLPGDSRTLMCACFPLPAVLRFVDWSTLEAGLTRVSFIDYSTLKGLC